MKFHMKDDMGLEVKVPYVSFNLTMEQLEAIKGKTPQIYQIDGKYCFEIRDNGKHTGEYAVFIIFK